MPRLDVAKTQHKKAPYSPSPKQPQRQIADCNEGEFIYNFWIRHMELKLKLVRKPKKPNYNILPP